MSSSSHLLPISMIVIFGLACCLDSSSHDVKCVKVSRLRYTPLSVNLIRCRSPPPKPGCYPRTSSSPSDVVYEQCTSSTSVVGASDRTERLLSSLQQQSSSQNLPQQESGACRVNHRIPYLKLDLLLVDGDHASPKLNANGKICMRKMRSFAWVWVRVVPWMGWKRRSVN